MKKKKNKGFTLVEILAVITILGILSTIAVVSLVRYKNKARTLDYDSLASSSYHAYESYNLKHNKITGSKITLQDLYNEGLLESLKDPGNSDNECYGYVGSSGSLANTTNFDVYLCCSNYNYHYTYGSNQSKEKITTTSKCNP